MCRVLVASLADDAAKVTPLECDERHQTPSRTRSVSGLQSGCCNWLRERGELRSTLLGHHGERRLRIGDRRLRARAIPLGDAERGIDSERIERVGIHDDL